MQYTMHYQSPLGNLILVSDGNSLTGLWFEGQNNLSFRPDQETTETTLPIFEAAKHWLDIYFSGREPDFMPPLHPAGTDFQKEVWKILSKIPYGQTTTYGAIAKQIAKKRGLARMSAQAVGGAVGHNQISILIPCHRVIGKTGSLTGYAGGIEKKYALLTLEGIVLP